MWNLDSILTCGGLLATTEKRRRNIGHTDMANLEIQDRRALRPVRCCRAGTLHDYVPFFFCPRPPMLLAIKHAHGLEAERSIIHLVSTAQAVDSACAYFFTDGHGTMWLTSDYVGLHNLDKVDWSVIPLRQWDNTLQDGDRKRRKQAEFLVHRSFSFDLIERIGVYSHQVKVVVEQLLEAHNRRLPVTVENEWYYS